MLLLREDLRVVPQHVGAVDVHRHRVDVAILRDERDEGLGHDSQPAFGLIQIVQGLDLFAGYVGADQFLTSMTLPANRAGRQPASGWRARRAHWCQRRRQPRH